MADQIAVEPRQALAGEVDGLGVGVAGEQLVQVQAEAANARNGRPLAGIVLDQQLPDGLGGDRIGVRQSPAAVVGLEPTGILEQAQQLIQQRPRLQVASGQGLVASLAEPALVELGGKGLFGEGLDQAVEQGATSWA